MISGTEGVYSTAKAFEDAGIITLSVSTWEVQAPLIKESEWHQDCYSPTTHTGFNGVEAVLTRKTKRSCLESGWRRMSGDPKAEQEADITVMPKWELAMEPAEEQKSSIIRWFLGELISSLVGILLWSLLKWSIKMVKKQAHYLLDWRFPVQSASGSYGRWRNAQWTERGLDGCDHQRKVGRKTQLRRLLLIQPGSVGLWRASWRLWLVHYQTYILEEDFIQGGRSTATSWIWGPREREWTRFTEMKEHVHWIGLRVERNRAWKETWTGLLEILSWSWYLGSKFLTAIRPQQKAEEGLGWSSFAKKIQKKVR